MLNFIYSDHEKILSSILYRCTVTQLSDRFRNLSLNASMKLHLWNEIKMQIFSNFSVHVHGIFLLVTIICSLKLILEQISSSKMSMGGLETSQFGQNLKFI